MALKTLAELMLLRKQAEQAINDVIHEQLNSFPPEVEIQGVNVLTQTFRQDGGAKWIDVTVKIDIKL